MCRCETFIVGWKRELVTTFLIFSILFYQFFHFYNFFLPGRTEKKFVVITDDQVVSLTLDLFVIKGLRKLAKT